MDMDSSIALADAQRTDSDSDSGPRHASFHRRHQRHHLPPSEQISSSTSSSSTPSTAGSSDSSPRVVFGSGTIARLPMELGRLHLLSPLVVFSPSRITLAKKIQALIPNLNSRILDSAVVHVPGRVVDDAISRISGHDCVISVGGGSAVSLARAIGLRKGIPHVCIPSTYSGSEMTHYAVETRHRTKKSSRKARNLPAVVIYDMDLTTSTPKRISAPSGSKAAARSNECRQGPKNGDTLWSFIHLPGV
ncbi:hypothetical protein G7046_g2692 [Stylonectria norvegica]|nr:hypothetical protein G7046_g2692 [Stylonectria norvegica]